MNTPRSFLSAFLSFALLLTLAACDSAGAGGSDDGTTNDTEDGLELAGPTWVFASLEDSTGAVSGPGTTTLTITFAGDGRFRGHGVRNSFFGEYDVESENGLTVDLHGTTYAGTPQGSMYGELLGRLEASSEYVTESRSLRIELRNGGALLFEAED